MAADKTRIDEIRSEARRLTKEGEPAHLSIADHDVGLVHDHAREHADEVQAKEQRAIAGLSEDGPVLPGGVRSRYGDLGNAGIGSEGGKKGKRAAERAYRDMLLMSLMDQLQAKIDATVEKIGVLEDRLVAEFGDDFLEDNARMYLGEDMPERPPGMSDAAWDKILQDKLADKMLGPDGSIKPQYAHLDIAKWLAEQRRLAELEAQAKRVAEGAELLAEGGLSEAETAELRNRLASETLDTLHRAQQISDDDQLRTEFRRAGVGSHQRVAAAADSQSKLDSLFAGNERADDTGSDLGTDEPDSPTIRS